MSQVLYRKWRPQTWDEVVGQEHVITTLRNAVSAGRISHAFLFSGPRGTGKTSTARLLAKAANCLDEDLSSRPCNQCDHCLSINRGDFLDLIEIDAASNNGVDDVRALRDKINFSPNRGRYKVYIIDEVHMLSTEAFNALLKTLEEPPSHAIFVLATTEAHKIPATVSSRCQQHDFRRIPVDDIVEHLREVAEQEELKVERDALTLVARQATGSLRDAISLLDQLASTEDTITLQLARSVLGTAASQAVLDVIDAVVGQDAALGLNVLQVALDRGSDPRQFARQVVNYLRSLLFLQMENVDQLDTSQAVREKMDKHAQILSTQTLLSAIRSFNEAAISSRGFWQPSLPLELAFIDALEKVSPAEPPLRGEKKTLGSIPNPKDQPSLVNKGQRPQTKEGQSPPKSSQENVTPSTYQQSVLGANRNIFQEWNRILSLVEEEKPITQGMLRSSRPVGIKKGKLILCFDSELTKSKVLKGDHINILQQVVERVMGQALPIKCTTTNHNQEELPPNVKPDGMVSVAVHELGGKYVLDRD
ncbi:MAG: DNA polymerase III subunit tau [Chloroflexi bacterium]|nr:DNA polymerase III subunit tau [Chloroflexota bacterium]